MNELERDSELMNQVLEVTATALSAAEFQIRRYGLPAV